MPSRVLENQAQVRLERQVGSDVDAAERIGIFTIERFPVAAVIPGLQADMIGARRVALTGAADDEGMSGQRRLH